MDMKENMLTKGSVFKALFVFSLPIIITNTVNILFHAADVFFRDREAGGI